MSLLRYQVADFYVMGGSYYPFSKHVPTSLRQSGGLNKWGFIQPLYLPHTSLIPDASSRTKFHLRATSTLFLSKVCCFNKRSCTSPTQTSCAEKGRLFGRVTSGVYLRRKVKVKDRVHYSHCNAPCRWMLMCCFNFTSYTNGSGVTFRGSHRQ